MTKDCVIYSLYIRNCLRGLTRKMTFGRLSVVQCGVYNFAELLGKCFGKFLEAAKSYSKQTMFFWLSGDMIVLRHDWCLFETLLKKIVHCQFVRKVLLNATLFFNAKNQSTFNNFVLVTLSSDCDCSIYLFARLRKGLGFTSSNSSKIAHLFQCSIPVTSKIIFRKNRKYGLIDYRYLWKH